jgi:hypothetical protein
MKKFLTSVFMLSMVLFSMSVFDSCKDYDEDEYNDLLVKLDETKSDLKIYITNNINNLTTEINNLKIAQANCSTNCANKHAQLDAAIAALQTADQQLQTAINGKADQSEVDSLKGVINDLKTQINDLVNDIATLTTMDQTLQNQINTINTTLETVVGDLAALAGVPADVANNTQAIEDILEKLKDADGNVVSIKTILTSISTLEGTVSGLQTALNDLKTQFDNLDVYSKTEIDNLLADLVNFTTLQSEVGKVSTVANEALERAKNDSVWVKALEQTVADVNSKLNSRIDSLAGVTKNLEDVTKSLDDALKAAEANRIKADSLLQNQIDLLAVAMDDLNDKVDDILDQKLPDLEQAYKDADQLLQDSIDALAALVEQNAKDIETINNNINTITGRLDKIDEALKSQITGIVIQATENPVFGTFALPVGVNSNVLMAFYGECDNPIVFPTNETANYVKRSQQFSAADWAMIKNVKKTFRSAGNKTLFNESEGNAGTVYVTVNPGSVNFAGQTLELVNSKDEASKVTLSPLKKENDVELMFGYTRAAETNGFYSAAATLKEEDIEKAKVNFNRDGWKSAVETAYRERSIHSLSTIADLLYRQFDGLLPAQGLKASWTDYNGEHSVYSQYGIAATAFKPLSYKFLEDLNKSTLPGYERAIALVDRIGDRIKSRVPNKIMKELRKDLQGLTIKEIELKELTEDMLADFVVTIDDDITIDGQDFKIDFSKKYAVQDDEISVPTYTYKVYQSGVERGTVTIPEAVYDPDAYIEINFDQDIHVDGYSKEIHYVCDLRDAAQAIWGVSQSQIADINELIAQLPDLVHDAKFYIDLVNDHLSDVGYLVDEISTKDIKTYIDRLNNKIVNVVNEINDRIQPILLVGDRNAGMKVASRSKGVATQLKSGTVEFILTSYTAEILTPAFKKHIAVTNVFKGGASAQGGDAACKLALTTANAGEMMNTVIDGNKCSVVATFAKGYVYEVAYSALDYSGNISMHKYYVQY